MSKYGVISGSNTGKYGPEIVVKETWNIRTDYGKMEKLITTWLYSIMKSVFKKKIKKAQVT